MNAWTTRSLQKELLDADNIPAADLYDNLRELETINRYLGGHSATIFALNKLLQHVPAGRPLTIVELGSGGGDNLRAIARYLRKRKQPAQLIGVDLKTDAVEYARQQSVHFPEIDYVVSDYRLFSTKERPDIVYTSLFCHHLNDEQLVELMHWCQNNSRAGWFFNDLHRHPLAYHAIRLLTRLFSRSYLVKHDAPLSVKRGFTKKDWARFLLQFKKHAPVCEAQLYWRFAFRWVLLCYNTNSYL
jgi:SAM-dependent methyltransferase